MIKLFVTDFDGVMTNGKRYFDENNIHSKGYNMKDGSALKKIKNKGIMTMILSGDKSKVTKMIGERLNFDKVVTGCENKKEFLSRVTASRGELEIINKGRDVMMIMIICFTSSCVINV